MLGNQADAFFTTPMQTSVVAGNTRNALAGMMPAPFGSGSNTKQVTVSAGGMLPGLSGYKSPKRGRITQFGADPAGEIVADTKKFLGMSLPVLAVIAAAGFLFLTTPGAQIRAKIGF